MNHVLMATMQAAARQRRARELSLYELATKGSRNPEWEDYGTPGKQRRWNGRKLVYRDKPKGGGGRGSAAPAVAQPQATETPQGTQKPKRGGARGAGQQPKKKPSGAQPSKKDLVKEYERLRDGEFSVGEIREAMARFAGMPTKELEAAAQILGYAVRGKKRALAVLTQDLERMAASRSRATEDEGGGLLDDFLSGLGGAGIAAGKAIGII